MTQTFLSNQLALGNAYHNPYVKLYAWSGAGPFTSILQMLPAEQLTVVREGDLCLVRDPAATAPVLWRCTDATSQTALVWETATNETDTFVTTAVLVAPSTLRLTRNDAVNVDVDLNNIVDAKPTLTNRQGGHPIDWEGAGSTNYAVSGNIEMQIGSYSFTFLGTESIYDIEITFPVAFGQRPLVIASVSIVAQMPPLPEAIVIQRISPTLTGCFVTLTTANGSVLGTQSLVGFSWLAIGQAA